MLTYVKIAHTIVVDFAHWCGDVVPEVAYLKTKIAECRRLMEECDDPLMRHAYQAMRDEFAQRLSDASKRPVGVPPLSLDRSRGPLTKRHRSGKALTSAYEATKKR
jgi:hypothetical protein